MKKEEADWEIITRERLAEMSRQHLLFEKTGGKEGELFNFVKCRLNDADLSGMNIDGIYIVEARLENCTFKGADLRGATLDFSTFINVDFRDVDLQKGSALESLFENCNFDSANLCRMRFSETTINTCSFQDAEMLAANIVNCRFETGCFDKARTESLTIVDSDQPAPPPKNDVSVEILSPDLAVYEIVQREHDFGMSHEKFDYYWHKVGFFEEELFTLTRCGMDAPWRVEINKRGRLVKRSSDFKIEAPGFDEWIQSSRAKDGTNILNLLPTGKYFLVKSNRKPRYEDVVMLGNCNEEVPENVHNLLVDLSLLMCPQGEYTLGALVFGNRENIPPNLNQPLLGIPITHFNTGMDSIGVYFFSFSSPSEGKPDRSDDLPLLLILPMSTELVLDSDLVTHGADDTRKEIWEPNAEMIAHILRG